MNNNKARGAPVLCVIGTDLQDICAIQGPQWAVLRKYTGPAVQTFRDRTVAGQSVLHPYSEVAEWLLRAMPWVTEEMLVELKRRAVMFTPRLAWGQRSEAAR